MGSADPVACKAFRKMVRGATRGFADARAAADALVAPGALDDLPTVVKSLARLSRADLSAVGAEDERQAMVAELERRADELEKHQRANVLGGLRREAKGRGLTMSLVTEQPLTVRLAPVDVELDLRAGEARVLYARVVVNRIACEPRAVLKARVDALEGIRKTAVPSDAFFGHLELAYEMVLAGRRLTPGDRVDLVDLLGPLALAARGVDAWRDEPSASGGPYPRYLLAYQLQRLRREGGLARPDGRRVELGVATGGSARDKRNVLFIPSSAGEGQFHLSLRISAP